MAEEYTTLFFGRQRKRKTSRSGRSSGAHHTSSGGSAPCYCWHSSRAAAGWTYAGTDLSGADSEIIVYIYEPVP